MTPRCTLRRAGTFVLVGATLSLGLPTAQANSTFAMTRVSGADRFATAANLAASAFAGGAADAIVARGDAFADALAGGYLAGRLGTGAPILLTNTGSVPQVTKDRLQSLGVRRVFVLGGTGAVSAAVESDLKATYTVTRIPGANRYATAAAVARQPGTAGIGAIDGKRAAILASGESFADALAAGPIAYAGKLPILLTGRTSLPTETRSALTALGIQHVVIAGGTGAVSAAVESSLTGLTKERVAGADRYATAAELADFALAKVPGWSDKLVALATGEGFADALAGGPTAGKTSRAILLTAKDTLSKPTSDWLVAHTATLETGQAYGGPGALADTTVAAAQNAGRGVPAGTATGQLTRFNTTNKSYTYVPTGASSALTVTYAGSDTFTVDNQTATVAAFEGALSAGDQITNTPASGTTPPKHELTNVAATTFTTGMVGNVNLGAAAPELDIVNAVTGDPLRPNLTWGDSNTFKVDGTTASRTTFQNSVNEGDTIAVSGTAYELTNADLTGAANTITKSPLPVGSTTFKIGELGDNPASGEDGSIPSANSDSLFSADGAPTATDRFVVDGNSSATYANFSDALSVGDRVTYSRREAAVSGNPQGAETFTLVNRAPTPITGQAAGTLTADNPPPGTPDADGGSFTVATSTGTAAIAYTATGTFVVDGALSTEKDLEAAWSAGDSIAFTPADQATTTAQRLELTNSDLAGAVSSGSINTTDSATVGNPSRPAKSYAVLATNGTTELATVVYSVSSTPTANTYVVNGTAADLAGFEAALNAIKAGTKGGTVVVQKTGSVQTHRLTTS